MYTTEYKISATQSLARLINFIPNIDDKAKKAFIEEIDNLTEDNLDEDRLNKSLSSLPILFQASRILFNAKQIASTLEDKYNEHTQDIALLRKNLKHYTQQHIERFNEQQKIYIKTGDKKAFLKLELYKEVFKSFQENPNKTIRMFGAAAEYVFLTHPDILTIKRLGVNPRNKSNAKKLLFQYAYAKEIMAIGSYFEGYGLQPKMIYMSAGIKIFKLIEALYNQAGAELDTKALKDAIEDIFFAIDKPIRIYPSKMDTVFVKASIGKSLIYAYASKNKSPIFEFKKTEEAIQRKLNNVQKNSIIKKRLYDSLLKPKLGTLEVASFLS